MTTTKAGVDLAAAVASLPGVGETVAGRLGKLGIRTVRDLLTHWPRRWLDLSQVTPIAKLRRDQFAVVRGTLHQINLERRRGKRLVRVTATLRDAAGSEFPITWFNQAYLARSLREGKEYLLAGTVKWDWYRKQRYLASPTRETKLGIRAIYPETKGINSKFLRRLIASLLPTLSLADPLFEHGAIHRQKNLPQSPIEKRGRAGPSLFGKEGSIGRSHQRETIMSLAEAIRAIHRPTTLDEAHLARSRLAFDEHLLLQLGLAERQQAQHQRRAPRIPPSVDALQRLVCSLPFSLTESQRRAAWTLIQRLEASHPTAQLLQGDVGSGKSVVAALVALSVLEAGYSVSWMVPTQVLAKQLHQRMSRTMKPTGHRPILVVAGKDQSINPDARLYIGTHALLSDRHTIQRLGLSIVDEQQRFGVEQRRRGHTPSPLQPHHLTMTATPIPRSLALAVLGQDELVTLSDRPSHQQPVTTRLATDRSSTYETIHDAVSRGHQGFVIVPRIEGQKDELFSQTIDDVASVYQSQISSARIGVLHGRLDADEQGAILNQFVVHQIDLLVATTVVEVGVDVPNATVMVIENAEQFGLAQLHQLRGRIGRGTVAGTCIAISQHRTEIVKERLAAFASSTDGFTLARKDLQLRGPGELLGTVQSGLPQLRLASLDDTLAIERARAIAQQWVAVPPAALQAWRQFYHRGTEGDDGVDQTTESSD